MVLQKESMAFVRSAMSWPPEVSRDFQRREPIDPESVSTASLCG